MKLTRCLPVISSLLLGALSAAEPPSGTPASLISPPAQPGPPPQIQSESAVYLDIGFATRLVGTSRITVPLGEKLRIVAPLLDDGTTYVWLKNGRTVQGAPNSNVLLLDYVTSADAGTYLCQFTTPTAPQRSSQALLLGVGPVERLLNLSTRAFIGPAPDQSLTTGFVVGGGTGAKRVILRVIGPSLAAFGVANPLRQPVLRIYDANGRLYENAYAYAHYVGAPTYESDLAAALDRAGAFPLPPGTADIVEMRPFPPGTYTATVTTGDGTPGHVLLEIYEVP